MLSTFRLARIGAELRNVNGDDWSDFEHQRSSVAIESEDEQPPSSITVGHPQPSCFAHEALYRRIPAPTHKDSDVLNTVNRIGDGGGGNRASALEVPQLLTLACVIGGKVP